MKILFLGGKRILGKSIVKKLIKIKNLKVFIASRKRPDYINKRLNISFIKLNRKISKNIKEILNNNSFDIIFDNNCYQFEDFINLYKLIKKKKNFYFFTSSIISYLNFNKIRKEVSMKKTKVEILNKNFPRDLALNKRKIEIYLLNQNYLKFCILKMHNIIGKKDHSNKTNYIKNFNVDTLKRLNIKNTDFLQFAFINDIVNIVIKLVKNKMIGKKINKIYNIANDYLTYDQLIKMNSRKRDNKYIKDEIIKNVLVDNTKIKRDLNFKFTSNKKIMKLINYNS